MIAVYNMSMGLIHYDLKGRPYIYQDVYVESAKRRARELNEAVNTDDFEVRRIEITDIGGIALPPSKEREAWNM